MKNESRTVRFLYGTAIGRAILKCLLRTRADRVAVWFLRSGASRPIIRGYAKRHGVVLERGQSFATFRDFFARVKNGVGIDITPEHLIAPCDGWLSSYPIAEDSSFFIKGAHYRLGDLLRDEKLAKRFHGGDCLVFRLTPADYHHYCYIDDGYQGENHFIPGELHSVQSAACERYPVYTLNRRCWTLLETERFGPVVQTEIGAFVVGGIVNERENEAFCKGEEMGHFELAGSTVVLLFEKGRIALASHIRAQLGGGAEFRVTQGMCLGGTGGGT